MIGFLRWKENSFFRSHGAEFKIGDETPIYSVDHHRIQEYIGTGDVDVLDKDQEPTTWKKLCDSQPPQQERVIVPTVKASTRPVRKGKEVTLLEIQQSSDLIA